MDQNAVRKYILGFIVIVVAIIFIVKLFYLQVINTEYKTSAEMNSRKYINQYPARGLIYDRNGKLMVFNQPAYDVLVTPYLLKPFDTLALSEILQISKDEINSKLKEAYKRPYQQYEFIKQISSETYAVFQEKLFKFPGFDVQSRTLRKYSKKIASHVLGYVGEADEETVKKNKYYELRDYIGISGLEKAYEKELRGEKGKKILLVDVRNRIQGPYQDGKYDKDPVVGRNITISLDMDLQEYGEMLMQNKRGSIVAIEPSTGEILAMVSSPTYDPELLVGRNRSRNFRKLQLDTLHPLFNRAIMAKYRPGSTFKLVNGAIALQEGILGENTLYSCAGAYKSGPVTVGCHNYRSPLNVKQAIQYSSNNFFCQVFRNTLDYPKFESFTDAFNIWRNHVLSMGFGSKLGDELPHELAGYVPSVEYYNRMYGQNRWKSLTVISLAIGEGEMGITPFQLANLAAIIANRGYYYQPHLIKSIDGVAIENKYHEQNYTTIDSTVYEIIVEGMEQVVNGGPGSTAGWVGLKDIVICGKTGTAQNESKKDHSVFVAFAPKENPKIAIMAYIEYGGWGGSWAAPIASLMIEKYLTGDVKRTWIENRILNAVILTDEKED